MGRLPLLFLLLVLGAAGCATRLPTPSEAVPLSARLRPSDDWARREACLEARARTDRDLCCACRRRANRGSWCLAGAGLAATAVYGLAAWDYGTSTLHLADEDWFGEGTEFGGADKAGHFITAYFGTAAVAAVHRRWGCSRREAALRGALTSMLWMTGIEVGDALAAKYGFAGEDLAMDALGCVAGYLHETNPWVHRVVDFRWEYLPTQGGLDGSYAVSDDYSGSSYLAAFNVGALVSRAPTAWDLLDVQLGYQTRGYPELEPDPERWVYVGVGLNLANLLRRVGFRYAAFFDYYQVPFISLRLGYELNDGETSWLYAP